MRHSSSVASAIAVTGNGIGQVVNPTSIAVDAMGNLYVAEVRFDLIGGINRIQERDTQGHWSVIATDGADIGADSGRDLGHGALAVDAAGALCVGDSSGIQRRDIQGHWSVLASDGTGPGEVSVPTALAVDPHGNLYTADSGSSGSFPNVSRIQRRDVQGNWTTIAAPGAAVGQVRGLIGLAADAAGNLCVADTGNNRLLKYEPGP